MFKSQMLELRLMQEISWTSLPIILIGGYKLDSLVLMAPWSAKFRKIQFLYLGILAEYLFNIWIGNLPGIATKIAFLFPFMRNSGYYYDFLE